MILNRPDVNESASLSSYLWPRMRLSTIVSWTSLLLLSLSIYIAGLSYIKFVSLENALSVANSTIAEAIEIGDWNFVLTTLDRNAATSAIYNLALSSEDGKQSYAGPFGKPGFGVGEVCKQALSANNLKLVGCARILNKVDLSTLILLIVTSVIFGYIVFSVLQSRTIGLFERIADLLTKETDRPTDIREIDAIKNRISELIMEKEALSKSKALAEIATQVAHDIRSPLSALRFAIAGVESLPADRKTLITQAVKRIEGIANQLLLQHRRAPGIKPKNSNLLEVNEVMQELIAEKKLMLRENSEIQIVHESPGTKTFVEADQFEFSSMISNLLNNSVESLNDKGTIKIKHSISELGQLDISISDNGPGFPADVLRRGGERGYTFGKSGGSGLGLSGARKFITDSRGHFQMENLATGGAMVTLKLPIAIQCKGSTKC